MFKDFKAGWDIFTKASVLSDESNISLLISVFRRKFETKVEFLYGYHNFAALRMDLSKVKVRLSKSSLVCLIRIDEKRGATASEAFRLLTTSHYADSLPGYCTMIIVHSDSKELKMRCKNALQDAIILDRNQVEDVIASGSWSDTLAKVIRAENEPDILSPYDEIGICSPELFLGREKEIIKLTSHAKGHGYSLVGCRRVGKSSLLLRLKKYYNQTGEPSFYIDCQSCHSTETFYEEIIKRTYLMDFEKKNDGN